jgi:hypothetical protein
VQIPLDIARQSTTVWPGIPSAACKELQAVTAAVTKVEPTEDFQIHGSKRQVLLNQDFCNLQEKY